MWEESEIKRRRKKKLNTRWEQFPYFLFFFFFTKTQFRINVIGVIDSFKRFQIYAKMTKKKRKCEFRLWRNTRAVQILINFPCFSHEMSITMHITLRLRTHGIYGRPRARGSVLLPARVSGAIWLSFPLAESSGDKLRRKRTRAARVSRNFPGFSPEGGRVALRADWCSRGYEGTRGFNILALVEVWYWYASERSTREYRAR